MTQDQTPIRLFRPDEPDDAPDAMARIDRVAVQVVVSVHAADGRKIGERPCAPTVLFEPLAENLRAHAHDALRAVRDQIKSEEA